MYVYVYMHIYTFIRTKSSGSGGLTKGVAFAAQKGFAPGRGERNALFMRRIWPGPLNFLQRRRSKNKYILSVKKFVGVRMDNGAGDCTPFDCNYTYLRRQRQYRTFLLFMFFTNKPHPTSHYSTPPLTRVDRFFFFFFLLLDLSTKRTQNIIVSHYNQYPTLNSHLHMIHQ